MKYTHTWFFMSASIMVRWHAKFIVYMLVTFTTVMVLSLTQTKSPLERLSDLHRTLRMVHGSLDEEVPEQLMAVQFVPSCATVLELGGNVGRNSLVLGSLLDDSSRLVVFESDPHTAQLLKENRDANGMAFHIEDAALSKRALTQSNWETTPVDTGPGTVRTMSWEEVRRKYAHLSFDTLVLDCEGAIYYILLDEPDFFEGFETVIIENDFQHIEHKRYCDERLHAHGFTCVYTEPGPWGPCRDMFFQTWKKL